MPGPSVGPGSVAGQWRGDWRSRQARQRVQVRVNEVVGAAMPGRGVGNQGYSLVAGLRPYMQKGGVGPARAV